MTNDTECSEIKAAVAGAIRSVLDKIVREVRQPDDWERAHLISAIAMLFRGAYSLADLHTMEAAAAVERRSLQASLTDVPGYDTAALRAALDEAVAEPLRDWPHFGPIAFRGRS